MDWLLNKDVMVYTKYKTVANKMKPNAGPQPINNEEQRKEVSIDPTLTRFVNIRHNYIDETQRKLWIIGEKFILLEEEEQI